MNYYNEFDPKIAAWLRQLIASGHIPAGEVDERSIEDVKPGDLRGFTQCHFFAGIGGWSYALDLAGWPADQPVWTGSCPCQPFSAAGQVAGFEDERHLWPAWQHLIAQCRPPIIFGEQVAGKASEFWIDLVHADLENMDYAFGCIPFPSASIGAPHTRDRNYWTATDSRSVRGARQGIPGSIGTSGQGRPDWTVDMCAILNSPYSPGLSHPQPLLRRMDDGFSDSLVGLRGYGNAINPHQAAEFICATVEAIAA